MSTVPSATAAAGGPPPSSGSKRKWINVDIVKAIDPEQIVLDHSLEDRDAAIGNAQGVINAARANVTEQFQILQNEVAERTVEVNTLADEVTKLRGELAGKTEELSNLNERIQELSSGLESFCSTMGSEGEDIGALIEAAESFNTGGGEELENNVKNLVGILEGKLKELKELKEEKKTLEGDVESNKEAIEGLEAQLEESKGEVDSLKAQVENLGSELATTTDKNSELKTQIKEQQAKIRKIEESVSAALAGAKEAGLVANASSEAVADADDDIKTLETGINGLISALEKATEEIKDVGEETEKAGDSIREAFTPLISGEGGEGGLKPEVQGEEVNASGESKHGKAIGALNKVAKKTQEKVGAAETLGEKVRAEVKGLQKVIGIIGAKQKRTKAKLREAIAEANEAIQAAMAETTKANERITAEKIRNANLEARLRELEAENERLRQGLRDIGTMKPSEPAGDQAEISSTAKAVLGELKERRESAKLEIGTLLETLKSSNSDEESNVLTQLFSKLKMWFKTLGTNERGQVLVFLKDEGLPQGKKNAFLESLVESLNGEVKPEDITFADAVRKAIEGDERFDQNLKGQLGARIEALRQAAAAES